MAPEDPTDERAFRLALQGSRTPTIITDTAFEITWVNDAFESFTGYDRSEIRGHPPDMLFGDAETFVDAVDRLSSDDTWSGTFEARTKAGETVYGEGVALPLDDGDERVGYVGFFTDLTTRRHHRRTLAVLNRVLRHDVRNRLNIVTGYVELAEDRVGDEDAATHLGRAREEATRLVETADRARLLEYPKPGEPRRLDAVDCSRTLADAVRTARERYPTATFDVDLPSGITVLGDDRLQELFVVLLENAVEHNDHDSAEVRLTATEDGERVEVRVVDDGPGIDPALREALFGDREEDQLHHGEGLSLFVVRSVLDQYGGAIDVASAETGGSQFVVELRSAPVEASD